MQSPDQNVERNRQLLLDRSLVGLKKYGVTTERNDLTVNEWLQHLLEELLDAANYVQAAKTANTLCGGGLAEALQQCITSMLDSGYNKDSVIIQVATEALAVHQRNTHAASSAALDVLAERQRQINAEGWTPEHDDEHDGGELAVAAAAYALHAADHLHPQSQGDGGDKAPTCWPWHNAIAGRGEGPEKSEPAWWKPGKPRRNLIKAAALIIAEIERLDRAALHDGGDQ